MSGPPPGWAETTIGSVCDLVNGKAFKPTDWSVTGLPIVRIQNLNRPEARFNHFDGPVEDRFLIEAGDLLFAWSGTPGTSFGAHVWNGPRAVLNQHIFNVRFDAATLDRSFFRYAINQTLDEQIAKAHGGVGLRHVTKGKFEETAIAVPPLPEQRRIVAKIDSLTVRSRRARDHLDHIPRLVEKYKQAILAAAFRGDLTREWRVTRALPKPSMVRLVDLLASPIRNGLSVRGADQPPGIRALRLSALRSGCVDMLDVRYLPITEQQAARYLLHPGDVLVSRGNGTKAFVGRAALCGAIDAPTIFPDTAFRLRPDLAVTSPEWLVHIWNSEPVRRQIEAVAKTTAGIWKIAQSDLVEIKLLQPQLAEQREVALRLGTAFAWIDRLATEATSARKLIDRLDQSVLAKAFRGELVPQDPNDEPASVLLERIKAEREAAPKAKRSRKDAAEA